ncbi:1-deoxy-D-xylulose-5-phosphate reductoisomerase, partial [Bacillus cereus]|nr:1-deoxy-D-xylulose-5-phosphate reductoisomerase [Bacillus cereus]
VFNGANGVLVDAFLAGQVPYLAIVDTVQKVVAEFSGVDEPDLAQLHEAENWARTRAKQLLN